MYLEPTSMTGYQLLLNMAVENIWLLGLYWSQSFVLIYWFYTKLVVFVLTTHTVDSQKSPSDCSRATGPCGRSNGKNIPMPRPYIWHNMEVKHILKQLENVKQSSGNQVCSSRKPRFCCITQTVNIYCYVIYLWTVWGHFLTLIVLQIDTMLCDLPMDCLGALSNTDSTTIRYKRYCCGLLMLKVTKCQAIQLKVIEL